MVYFKNFIIFSLIIFSFFCKAQTISNSKNNAISIELGKNGLIWNLIFDHKFSEKKYGLKIDFGSNFGKYLRAFTTGIGGYNLFGKNNRFLELGLDLNYLKIHIISDDQVGLSNFVYPYKNIETSFISLNIGYRKCWENSIFKVGFSPGFIKNEFIIGGYISFGKLF